MSEDDLRTAIARPIYDILEGPIASQDYGRQVRQWERSLSLADAAIAAYRSHPDGAAADRHPTEYALNNLLAIIHRDGGHHTGNVGVNTSVKDAHLVWVELINRAEKAEAERDAEREWTSHFRASWKREKARAEESTSLWKNNLHDTCAALKMVREAIETLGGIGILPSEEAVLGSHGPLPSHDASVMVEAIKVICARAEELEADRDKWKYLADEWQRQHDTASARAAEWEARHDLLEEKRDANWIAGRDAVEPVVREWYLNGSRGGIGICARIRALTPPEDKT